MLRQIREKVVEAIGRSDNYICAQDLSRFYYLVDRPSQACQQPPSVPPVPMRVQDRLKLDVAVSEGGEIYSWYGAHKFSANSVGQVVRDGPISSGSFNGYLRNIFGEKGVEFIYKGRQKWDGVDVYLFDYRAPLNASHYELQAGKVFVKAPFHGSFAAKADTFELYSLIVTANGDQIPDKTDICAAETRLVYQVVHIADHNSLLPASFDLLLGGRNGVFTESKGVYSECHEYKGESTVHFDLDDTAAASEAAPELESEPLRPGLYFQIALRGVIDEDSAYAGLPVEATLVRDVRLRKGEMLERGAILKGTITRFEVFHQPAHQVKLSLEFNSITDGKKIYLCNATHEVLPTFQPGYPGVGRRGDMPSAHMAQPKDPGDGSLEFVTPHLHLDKHFTSTFITVSHSEFAER